MLTVVHTNDFHNRLNLAQAQRLRQFRASLPGAILLLDAGDAVGSGNITFRPGGEPVLDLMSEAGYDAMTVGNREFHFSKIGFTSKLCRARFPALCANVHPNRNPLPNRETTLLADDAPDLPTVPYLLRDIPDFGRVLIFGLTVPMITERMLSRKVSSYVFSNPLPTAVALVPKWRDEFQPDLVIALTHIGLRQDRLLAEQVSGIDLIIGGHSHDVLEHGKPIDRTLIVQTGSHGRFFGVVTIEREAGEWKKTARLETL